VGQRHAVVPDEYQAEQSRDPGPRRVSRPGQGGQFGSEGGCRQVGEAGQPHRLAGPEAAAREADRVLGLREQAGVAAPGRARGEGAEAGDQSAQLGRAGERAPSRIA
jgi:hypothetical protein